MKLLTISYLFSLCINALSNTGSFSVNSNEITSYDTHLTNLDIEETCNLFKTEEFCHTNSDCSWCSSGAVKSQCHSLENANKLPATIFSCNKGNELNMIHETAFFDDYLSLQWHPKWVDFLNFIETFNKKYNENDIETKFNTFLKNLDFIENNDYSFELGINHYADLSPDEFQEFVKSGGYINKDIQDLEIETAQLQIKRSLLRYGNIERKSCESFKSKAITLPDFIDWRDKNAVTDVKDQGHCGSCWSFSATGSMEGAWAIKTGKLVSFSEQQLIDCSSLYGNSGCNGGLMESAFEYAIDKGMCSESDLPYEALGKLCSNCNKIAHFNSCVSVTSNNQLHLKEAVSRGPVSVAIEADTLVFQFYKSGIIDDVKCGTNLDHGVLIVGYGSENGKDYWIVKNSWGPGWGDKGFVKIARTNNINDIGICGIAAQPSYIVV